jgi:type IV pilus assembly protein PilE
MRYSRNRGFTLIELFIVIAVIAILAAIAVPNYQGYLRKSARSAAQAQMMDIANRQQQFLLANRVFVTDVELEASGFALEEKVSSRYTYDVTVGAGAVPSFLITFTATGAQVETDAALAALNTLTLNNAGVKTPLGTW